MRKYFYLWIIILFKKNRKFSWEIVINNFIQENPKSFKILKNQNFPWININRKKIIISQKKF